MSIYNDREPDAATEVELPELLAHISRRIGQTAGHDVDAGLSRLTNWMLERPIALPQYEESSVYTSELRATSPGGGGCGVALAQATSLATERRIVGAERQVFARDLVKRYTAGESIRALAAATGRSYGFIHRVLTESGVQLRQRGGARRRKKL